MCKSNRDHSVTIAKASTIILMVLAHAGCPRFLGAYIAMFHMPLFFIMSGYCFKTAYLNGGGAMGEEESEGHLLAICEVGYSFCAIT